MSSFEAVIDRMKQEGDLNRNSGTNSIKSLKEKLDSSNIILSNILNALKKNVVGGTSSTPLSRLVSQQPLQKEGATSELSKESSIFKLLSAATKFQAMRPIKALGDTASSIGSSLKEKFGINSFQKAFSDRLENLKSSLFQSAGGKEEETSSDIEETLSENLSSDGPIVSAIETQTTHIKELVGLFKDFIFQGRQSELERNDLESEAQSPDPEQPTIVEEEEEKEGKSIFGIIGGLISSLAGMFMPFLTLLANPAVLTTIAALTALAGLYVYKDEIKNFLAETSKSIEEYGKKIRKQFGISEEPVDDASGASSDFGGDVTPLKYSSLADQKAYNKSLEDGRKKTEEENKNDPKFIEKIQNLSINEIKDLKPSFLQGDGYRNPMYGYLTYPDIQKIWEDGRRARLKVEFPNATSDQLNGALAATRGDATPRLDSHAQKNLDTETTANKLVPNPAISPSSVAMKEQSEQLLRATPANVNVAAPTTITDNSKRSNVSVTNSGGSRGSQSTSPNNAHMGMFADVNE